MITLNNEMKPIIILGLEAARNTEAFLAMMQNKDIVNELVSNGLATDTVIFHHELHMMGSIICPKCGMEVNKTGITCPRAICKSCSEMVPIRTGIGPRICNRCTGFAKGECFHP